MSTDESTPDEKNAIVLSTMKTVIDDSSLSFRAKTIYFEYLFRFKHSINREQDEKARQELKEKGYWNKINANRKLRAGRS